jgi:hypothetical protein
MIEFLIEILDFYYPLPFLEFSYYMNYIEEG